MIDDVLNTAEEKMGKAIEIFGKEMAGLRTGRASPSLVERIRADYYGVPTPLNQIATISVPEARMLTIQPWDKSSFPDIEKAIQKSDIGLNPSSDGNIIRLAIPELSEERRKDLVKTVRRREEDERVAIRNVRREALEKLRQMQKDKEISEDEEKRAEQDLQKLTDKYIEQIDSIGKDKEREIMED